MPRTQPPLPVFCDRFQSAIEIIGRRWTGAILRALMGGATRFGELRTQIPGMSDRLLSERLKELEAEGLVRREVIADTPVRIEYHLTERGQALDGVVREIARWVEEWGPRPADGAPRERVSSRRGSR
ncbi:MAG TPA: helix-turn-helix domain-containing protein [Actinomycetota bacterium]|nr:helix-turn-helix domain-containing protein [Actinomycetota bacterium]